MGLAGAWTAEGLAISPEPCCAVHTANIADVVGVLVAPPAQPVPLTIFVLDALPLVSAQATQQLRSHTGMILALRAAAKTPGG